MTRYMKDSGVEWIGEIPEKWEMKKVKSFLREKSEKNHPDEEVLSLYREHGVIPKNSRTDNHNVTSQDTSSYKYVEKDNVVINKMKAWQGSLAVSNYQGIVSPAYYIYEIKDSKEIFPKFLHYALRNPLYTQEYFRISAGLRVGQWDLNKSEFNGLLYPIPPIDEQVKIGELLNEKSELVDRIIEYTKQSIEELKKYKKSLITEVVTKGLDDSVKMKDSGIEWIGEIPENWEVIKMKQLGQVRNGLTYDPSDVTDEANGVIVLRSNNIQEGKLNLQDNVYVRSDKAASNIYVRMNDILICSRNGSRNLIGKSAIIEKNINATFGAFMMIFRPENINSKYVYYLLNSGVFNYYLGTFLTSTINQLTKNNFDNMKIVFTSSLEEQKGIVEYLDKKTFLIDKLISDKNQLVSEYESLKKSLIYEYVTGKKQV